ncbi:signal peptidase II [Candidatus Peregrinibacteria bacterium]|nr:signal peptidase II [Candidatus Peregrinibacteria bacterium]
MKKVLYIAAIAIVVFLLNKATVFFTSLMEPDLIHKNTNIAFSIPLPALLIMVLIPAIIMFGIYLAYRLLNFSRKSVILAVGLAIGGALSNAIDRIVYGAVLDYIDVKFWPVFNIADIAITVGILLVIFFYDKMRKIQ